MVLVPRPTEFLTCSATPAFVPSASQKMERQKCHLETKIQTRETGKQIAAFVVSTEGRPEGESQKMHSEVRSFEPRGICKHTAAFVPSARNKLGGSCQKRQFQNRAEATSTKVQPLFRLQENNLKGESQKKVDTNVENVERKTFQRTLQPFLQLQKTSRRGDVRKVVSQSGDLKAEGI